MNGSAPKTKREVWVDNFLITSQGGGTDLNVICEELLYINSRHSIHSIFMERITNKCHGTDLSICDQIMYLSSPYCTILGTYYTELGNKVPGNIDGGWHYIGIINTPMVNTVSYKLWRDESPPRAQKLGKKSQYFKPGEIIMTFHPY